MSVHLTILTVSHGHRTLLLENVGIASVLNRDFFGKVTWHIAENSPPEHPDRFDGDEAGLIVHQVRGETEKGISHHHASALSYLLKSLPLQGVVMILDPDLFLLQRDWVERIVDYMRTGRMDFFGVPWHPRHSDNYRYFPAVHCFLFNADRINPSELDFSPKLEVLQWKKSRSATLLRAIPAIGYRFLRRSWDTGTLVAEKYSSDARVRYEVVTPICRRAQLSPNLAHRMLNRILPDALCYLPKRVGYTSTQDFKDRGWISDELPESWECFVWEGAAFALHVRRSFGSQRRNNETEFAALRVALEELTKVKVAPSL